MSRTRRGFFRAVGLAVVAGPVAIPAALTKVAPKAAETIQRARIGMFMHGPASTVRIGERVVVESSSNPVVPRVAGVVESINLRATTRGPSDAEVLLRVSKWAEQGARDVTSYTHSFETWTEKVFEAAAR